jgi:hypothetical protein
MRIDTNGALVTASMPGLPPGATEGDQLEIVNGVPDWQHATVESVMRVEQFASDYVSPTIALPGDYDGLRIRGHCMHQVFYLLGSGGGAYMHGVFTNYDDSQGVHSKSQDAQYIDVLGDGTRVMAWVTSLVRMPDNSWAGTHVWSEGAWRNFVGRMWLPPTNTLGFHFVHGANENIDFEVTGW